MTEEQREVYDSAVDVTRLAAILWAVVALGAWSMADFTAPGAFMVWLVGSGVTFLLALLLMARDLP